MITLVSSGFYKLIETKSNTKILYLDSKAYAWVEPAGLGEILISTQIPHRTDCILSIGHYNMYVVEDEPFFSDTIHLELEVGRNSWQGYLLITGLPDDAKIRRRIIPTHEIITGNPRHKHRPIVLKRLAKK